MIDSNTATSITCTFVVIMAAISAIFAIVRIVKGPTDTDRIIGLDILFSTALLIGITSAVLTGRTVFIDVGLGLSLCHSNALAHGGSIEVAAADPHGSVFTIELPVADVSFDKE